jgi:HD-like signal output (HDOD) protein
MDNYTAAISRASGSIAGLDRSDVTALLQRAFSSPGYKPPMLPAVAIEVMQLSQRPNVQFEEVVELLQKDAVLAARVLSIAQSASYVTRSPIQTLQQASMRLGLKNMRDVVLEAALNMKVFRVPGFEGAMELLGRHSAATAHVMRAVCRRTHVESEHAFLCGLLHDVGFAGSLLVLADDPAWRRSSFEELKPVLDEVHEEASGLLTRLWKLPENIQHIVATHHEPAPGGKIEPVNAALVVAEQLVWEAGAGMEPPPEDADPLGDHMPEPPHDGIDINWTGVVEEALNVLRMDELALGASRAEAFLIVQRLSGGTAGGAQPQRPARRA